MKRKPLTESDLVRASEIISDLADNLKESNSIGGTGRWDSRVDGVEHTKAEYRELKALAKRIHTHVFYPDQEAA